MTWSVAKTVAYDAQVDRQALVYAPRFYLYGLLPLVGIRRALDRLRPRKNI